MKNWMIVLALAVVLFAVLAIAQERTDREQAIEDRIGRIQAELQLIQGDLNALARKYPRFFAEKGTARKQLQAVLDAILKGDEAELRALGNELAGIRKAKTPPLAVPQPKKEEPKK